MRLLRRRGWGFRRLSSPCCPRQLTTVMIFSPVILAGMQGSADSSPLRAWVTPCISFHHVFLPFLQHILLC